MYSVAAKFVVLAIASAGGWQNRTTSEGDDTAKKTSKKAVPRVTVKVSVRVPPSTPKDAQVCLVGSAAEIGSWKPPGLKLKRQRDGRYGGQVEFLKGSTVEYKYLIGTWKGVEKRKGGKEIANRTLKADNPGMDVEDEVEEWAAADAEPLRSTLSGEFRYHHDFKSKHLGNKRSIVVYLPPGYSRTTKKRFPVLYLQDGQNVFDAATSAFGIEWQCDETAERLIKAKEIEPLIMVGIYNTPDRLNEYSAHYDKRRKGGGRGTIYARFLAEELKPFIDETYRTKPERENTAVAGSSMGGLISLHIVSQFPDRFSMCAALSPSLWWCNEQQVKDLKRDGQWANRVRFWIDMGTAETGGEGENNAGIDRVLRVGDILRDLGLKDDQDLKVSKVPGGRHNESDWADRFDQVLKFFFPKT